MMKQEETRTEVIYAAKGAAPEWQFSGNPSSLFTYACGDRWASVVYAPYYKDFWSLVLAHLDQKAHTPVEITLNCDYTYGTVSRKELEDNLDSWRTNRLTRTKPNIISAAEKEGSEGDETYTIVHMVIDSFTVKPLDSAPLI